MGLEPCPYCGKEFEHDNPGARKNHVRACKEEHERRQQAQQEQQQGQQPAEQPAAEAAQGGAQPAEAPTAQAPPQQGGQGQNPQGGQIQPREGQPQGQGQSGVPATPEQMQTGVLGAAAGDLISLAGAGSPEEQAQAKGRIMKEAGMALAQAGERWAQQELQGIQNAQQADQGDVEVNDEYVNCPSCGGAITHIQNPDDFLCPHCGEALKLP